MPKERNQLSVVVPTYAEQDNIRPLTERLFKATKKEGLVVDLLFMDDDSGEGTRLSEEIVRELQDEATCKNIRKAKEKGKGAELSCGAWFREKQNMSVCCVWTQTCNARARSSS